MQGEDHASVCTQRDHMQAKAVPWVINTVVGGECVCVCVCVCSYWELAGLLPVRVGCLRGERNTDVFLL